MNHLANNINNFTHILYSLQNQNSIPFEICGQIKKGNIDRFSYPFGL
jgi:hypothetical protein